jgi:hypothetical protein
MPSKINPLIMIFYSLLLLQTSTKSRMKQGFDCRYMRRFQLDLLHERLLAYSKL